MSSITKIALAQAYIKLLESREPEKITVRDITDFCGLTRNTFYYHFHDVHDLLKWFFSDEAGRIMKKYFDDENWMGGMEEVLMFLYDHQKMMQHVYRSISHDTLVLFINEIMYKHARGSILREAEERGYSKEVADLASIYYTNAVVGSVMTWIREGMKESPQKIAREYRVLYEGTISSALESFEKALE